MKLLRCGFAVLLVVALLLPTALIAQEDSGQKKPLERIVLKDGSEIVGRVESETETTVTVRTLSGVVSTIPKDQIQSRRPVSGYIEGAELLRNDPNGSRLFFGPTGRTLKAGQGYFSIYEIFFPSVGIGVTDWLDVAGGLSLVPGASEQLYYLGLKVAPIQIKNFDLAGGVIFLNVTGNPDDFDGAGILHVIGTYGSEKAALTAGLGWGFSGNDVENNPVFILGGKFGFPTASSSYPRTGFPRAPTCSFSLSVSGFSEIDWQPILACGTPQERICRDSRLFRGSGLPIISGHRRFSEWNVYQGWSFVDHPWSWCLTSTQIILLFLTDQCFRA